MSPATPAGGLTRERAMACTGVEGVRLPCAMANCGPSSVRDGTVALLDDHRYQLRVVGRDHRLDPLANVEHEGSALAGTARIEVEPVVEAAGTPDAPASGCQRERYRLDTQDLAVRDHLLADREVVA